MKIEIKKDLFNISNRIKQIDKNYFIVFDTNLRRFEVHYKKQKDSTFCFVVDGPLNAMVLKKTCVTSTKFAKNLIRDMIKNNEKIDNKNKAIICEKIADQINRYVKFADKSGADCDFALYDQTIWL